MVSSEKWPEAPNFTSELKFLGHFLDVFSRKYPETPNLTHFPKSVLSKGGQSTDMIPVLQVVSIRTLLCKPLGNSSMCSTENAQKPLCKFAQVKYILLTDLGGILTSSPRCLFFPLQSSITLRSSATLRWHESKCNYFQVQVLASF